MTSTPGMAKAICVHQKSWQTQKQNQDNNQPKIKWVKDKELTGQPEKEGLQNILIP